MSVGAYLAVAAALFVLGLAMMIARRNLLYVLMGIELILNAANLNFVAFARYAAPAGGEAALRGQVFALIVILLAVAEAAVALAIVLHAYSLFDTVRPEEPDLLRE
jgi:NADH:ubiquinone oxidoreductase subunit K